MRTIDRSRKKVKSKNDRGFHTIVTTIEPLNDDFNHGGLHSFTEAVTTNVDN